LVLDGQQPIRIRNDRVKDLARLLRRSTDPRGLDKEHIRMRLEPVPATLCGYLSKALLPEWDCVILIL